MVVEKVFEDDGVGVASPKFAEDAMAGSIGRNGRTDVKREE